MGILVIVIVKLNNTGLSAIAELFVKLTEKISRSVNKQAKTKDHNFVFKVTPVLCIETNRPGRLLDLDN